MWIYINTTSTHSSISVGAERGDAKSASSQLVGSVMGCDTGRVRERCVAGVPDHIHPDLQSRSTAGWRVEGGKCRCRCPDLLQEGDRRGGELREV